MAAITDLCIDLARLRSDLDAVNALGRIDGLPGINRPAFSAADMAGRRWLLQRFEEAGLDARIDGIGNVFGRWGSPSGPVVACGSHLDTVPQGGPFDGTLGVLASLETVRAMQDAGLEPRRPVEVICTADEEGRFGGMLGSQALCGEVDAGWIARAVDDEGVRLADAMRAQGLQPEAAVARASSSIAVFLELHVEQGPVLERAGDQVGIVDAVSGVFNWTVTLTGEANHSGTTPMHLRRDALRGLADFAAVLSRIVDDVGTAETRLTAGKVDLRPNFPHTIAGEAMFSVVGRDTDEAVMRALAEACREQIDRAAKANGLEVGIREQSWLPPTRLDPLVAAVLVGLADASGLRCQRMVSGAGHDAQTFARHVPSGLIFVPSVGGVSHAPHEWTNWPDVEAGANLLARAIASFAVADQLNSALRHDSA